jgi:uncharacterized membrane protein
MPVTAAHATALLAVLASGAVAGLFFGYWCSVMPALDQMPARTAIAVMRRINVVIVNPAFLLAFLGTPLLLGLAAATAWWGAATQAAAWFAGAGLVYALGVFGITAGLNIPLNDALERLGDQPADPGTAWRSFATPWNRWNSVRTAASSATLVLAALGLRALP